MFELLFPFDLVSTSAAALSYVPVTVTFVNVRGRLQTKRVLLQVRWRNA